MSKLQPVRGTHDLLPEKSERFRKIEATCYNVAQLYGYGEIATPIFEFTPVFTRSIGDATDIVNKEMYSFEDRGGDSICLRPEGTASVVRAVISQGLSQHIPLKLYYTGPMFRYERPQKGRYRQFHQIGVEFFGIDKPQADIEVVALAWQMLQTLQLAADITLEINSIGDAKSRQAYKTALIRYLEPLKDQLSAESQSRLQSNPLRILDSKNESDQSVLANAPRFSEYLSAEARSYFEDVLQGLENLAIPYQINERLVRGLDYYDHTVFEFVTTQLGAQNAVLSGGRYNGLVEQMGGKPLPGIGFAAGLERLEMLVPKDFQNIKWRPIAIVPTAAEFQNLAMNIAHELRLRGHFVDMSYSGNFAKRMKKADKAQAQWAIILAEDEVKKGGIALKNLDTGEQKFIEQSRLIDTLNSAHQ